MIKAMTVYYDNDSGELHSVTFSPDFLKETKLMQVDVLQDAIQTLKDIYSLTSDEVFPTLKKGPNYE